MLRIIFFITGIISLIIAFIGVFLPILPTTPLVLVSAACFSRSSPKFHKWLLNNRCFGSTIKNWEEAGSMTLKAKVISIVFLNLTILISIYFMRQMLPVVIILILVSIGISTYLLRIPIINQDCSNQTRE